MNWNGTDSDNPKARRPYKETKFPSRERSCFAAEQRKRMASEVASTEDVLNALLEYLVDPRLPFKSSVLKEAPTLSQQQSVATQLHAVVILYNYYQRKQNPQAQYLDLESFCKLAITLRPALMSYMKFTDQSDPTASKDMNNDLSVAEKAIQDACNISCALDALRDVPSIKKWLISKVSVLLLDSKKEACSLLYSSVTEGVWSLLEKSLELPTAEIEGTVERKKRRTSIRPVTVERNDDDSGFQQLAFSAVQDATGIPKSDLVTLEKHVVYSLTKEKTASCFYIMQCTKSINEDLQIPVKEFLESLQGPLVKKSCGSWSATEGVEYFHLLPYASILSNFFLSLYCVYNTYVHWPDQICIFEELRWAGGEGKGGIGRKLGANVRYSPKRTTFGVPDMHFDIFEESDQPEEVILWDYTGDVSSLGGSNTRSHKDIRDSCEKEISESRISSSDQNLGNVSIRTAVGSESACKEASALKGSQSVEVKIEPTEAKTPDESSEVFIGTKSDHIGLEISEAKNGDGCHEKVGRSAVGQEATAVGGPHNIRESEETGTDNSVKTTEVADLPGDNLNGVNLKCLNDTSNKVHHEKIRDHEDSTVEELHGIIDHPKTPEEKTEEPVKSTKGCEDNVYNDMELAGSHLEPMEVKIDDGYHLSSSPTRPQRMDVDACIPCSKNGNSSKDGKLTKEVHHHQKKRTRESDGEIIGRGIIHKAQRAAEVKADEERDFSTISPNQNEISVAHTGHVPCKPESMDIGDLKTVLASKEEALTKSSLEVLLHKRQKLCHQQLKIRNEIASFDERIQRILDGGKGSLALKLETVLDFCDETCSRIELLSKNTASN
ncbi:putative serine/threonine-protein kinase BRI1-like 1-like [Capsicum annuum]|nr:putative serine/threonine-protein kinase BRI1-like 1-like [Capsicum annuum]